MQYKYIWRELTDDGLLKEPKDIGAYYEAESVNGYSGGFDTEQEAVDHFTMLSEKHGWACPRELVLIKIYSTYN